MHLQRRLVREVITDRRRRGQATLLVSHLLTEVEELCDRVGVLVDGRLLYTGTVAALRRSAAVDRGSLAIAVSSAAIASSSLRCWSSAAALNDFRLCRRRRHRP